MTQHQSDRPRRPLQWTRLPLLLAVAGCFAPTEPRGAVPAESPDRGEVVTLRGRVLGYPALGAVQTQVLDPPPVAGVIVELGLWHGALIDAMRTKRRLGPAEYGITWFEVVATTVTDAQGRFQFPTAPKWAGSGLRTRMPAGGPYEDFEIETSFFLGPGGDRDVNLAVFRPRQ